MLVIRDEKEWLDFADTCYLSMNKGGGFETLRGRNYELEEYTLEHWEDPYFTLKRSDTLFITTVYHTLLDKRIIIDGHKRAIALTLKAIDKMNDNGLTFPSKIIIYECYGSQTHIVFVDFSHWVTDVLYHVFQ